MHCPIQKENADVLLDYCARRLDAGRVAILERHAAGCPECRQALESQQAVWAALDAWDAMPVSLDFDRRLYRRIEEERRAGWLRGLWQRAFASGENVLGRPAFGLAAACVTVLAVFLVQSPVPVETESQPLRAEVVDFEQVERTLEDIEMLKVLNPIPTAKEAAGRSL